MSKYSSFKRSLAILTGLSLGTIHILNRLESTNACSKLAVHTREDKEYTWRYGKISYKKKGYGSPILLIHDLAIGSNKEEFSFIYNELSKNHTVYVPDLLGYGSSDKPAITYTASMYEQMISDFIKVVIASKVDIIVTGDTAPIILKLVHNNSEFINRIIMINPLGLYDQNLIPSNQTKLMKLLIDLPIIGTFVYNLKSTKQQMADYIKDKCIIDSDNVDTAKLEQLIDDYYKSAHIGGHESKYSYSSYLSKYTTCSILHELKEINNSIMIIGGEFEPDIKTNIENYLYYNNSIEYEYISDTSHLPHVEKPEIILDCIGVFLS